MSEGSLNAPGGAKGLPLMAWPPGRMCGSCAGRPHTEASESAETVATLQECIATGEPFYCHESVAVPDPNGAAIDRHGKTWRWLPESRWRLCRAWMNATRHKAAPQSSRVPHPQGNGDK